MTISIRSAAIILAAAAATMALPAFAAERPASRGDMEAKVTAPDSARPATRYCIKYMLTGSLIPRKTCKTRADWLAEDFDPLAKN